MSEIDLDKEFEKNTIIKKQGERYSVKCKKGLWGVSAPTKEEALREAGHYFIQYFSDGEYSEVKEPIDYAGGW